MSIISKLKNLRKRSISTVKLVNNVGNYFTAWDGNVYQNDIVRSALAARAKRISKIELKHCYKPEGKPEEINKDANYRFMLEEPNPYMTISEWLEKMSNLSALNGNAFSLIIRDENGIARQIFPLAASSVEARYTDSGNLYLIFTFQNGERWEFPYEDIIHLTEDFYNNDIFGTSKFPALAPLMEIVNTTDQGIVAAIKNSSVIRWLLRVNSSIDPDDVKQTAKDFAENYLKISNNEIGVAATDSKTDATQVTPHDYVPNAAQTEKTRTRILNLFNTNDKIIQSTANEDEENSYYESEIEPWVKRLAQEMTRKLFSRRQRGCGNYIIAGSFDLQAANLTTKLNLLQMVDRGALTPNEWRAALGLPPIEDGDKVIRRLDTQPVNSQKEGEIE